MLVKAYKTLDCANKVRIHYLLAQPISRDLFSFFPNADLSVQEFSNYVAGANDHFTLTIGNRVRATGVISEPKLVVTYAKADRDNSSEYIEQFEACLHAAGYDRIEYVVTKNAEQQTSTGI